MLLFTRLPVLTLTAVSLALPVPTTALAQTPAGALITFVMPAGGFGSDQFTDVLVNSLGLARKFCGALEKNYQADCLADQISKLSNDIPADSDYAEIRQVLDNTSKEIAQLTRSNRDAGRPRQKVANSSSSSSRPLTAVSDSSLSSVNQQAAAILERTETLLLRTPDDDTGKKLHYTRIAEALGSNKTLLRST